MNPTLETEVLPSAEQVPSSFAVHVVDDHEPTRKSIEAMISSMCVNAVGHKSAEDFLNSYDGSPGVLVCDLRMPGMSGLELQSVLLNRDIFMPVVMITGFAHTKVVVEGVRNGAVAVLEKPLKQDEFWLTVRAAMAEFRSGFQRHRAVIESKNRLNSLSPSERSVLQLVMQGEGNKAIAKQLDVSVRTVESRRRQILDKMGAANLVDLVRRVDLVELTPMRAHAS